MRRRIFWLVLLMLVSLVPMAMAASSHSAQAHLSGFNEVHFSGGPPVTLHGAISTAVSGQFIAEIDKQDDIIRYKLSYQDLEGTVTQAHIHFGQQHTVGGIVVWLCQTAGMPAPEDVADLTPFCPNEGTVTGTITPAQVLNQTAQGISAEEFNELVDAIRAGATYVNVHSSLFPPGEIRGQLAGGQGK
jgi:CHRD domain